jgi:ABC-type multidrug transport system fused ATPase/permease subunit
MLMDASQSGEVLLDGENIKNLKTEWLRSQIGLVSQEAALFATTIRDNILYGRRASLDEIEEAAKMAHAHTFISSLPEGYETKVALSPVLISTVWCLFLNRWRFFYKRSNSSPKVSHPLFCSS